MQLVLSRYLPDEVYVFMEGTQGYHGMSDRGLGVAESWNERYPEGSVDPACQDR